MNLSPSDRIALILGRAIIRAEGLEAALQEAQAKIAALEAVPTVTTEPPAAPAE